jgi:hypothetical protein
LSAARKACPHFVHSQTDSGQLHGSRINAAAVNAGGFSCTGGVGNRYILGGEVEGEEDAEVNSHISGPLGDVSSERGA